MFFKPTDFYSRFQVNYYDYKQLSLAFLLENFKELKLENSILLYKEEDFKRALKSEIRQTYFHAIETVFELLLGLKPNELGQINEEDLIITITNSKFPYEAITSIAEHPEENLSFLDKEIELTDHIMVTIGNYIFYKGHYAEEMNKEIQKSLEGIKLGLKIIANDFSDRMEYNCYKHGLRPINAIKQIMIQDDTKSKTIASWDLSDSMTYYSEDRKSGAINFVTKVFDTERDLKMTSFCSGLIWNIIHPRRITFNKNAKRENIPFTFYDVDLIKNNSKPNIPINDLKFNWRPNPQ